MRSFKKLIVGSLVVLASTAHAQIIDFVYLTEGAGQLGESAWNPLSITTPDFTVTITATQSGNTAYAYLDNNHAGLGVCGNASNVGQANPGSGSNLCDPSNDDNVTIGETLYFVFSEDVTITKIWFNNTHDEDFEIIFPLDLITIAGMDYEGPGNGYAPTSSGYNIPLYMALESNYVDESFDVAANTPFSIAFNNQQFYVSGMEVTAVPEPGTLALLGSGLLGIGLFRRRRQG